VATPEELAKYIQFQLERLGERNAHHEFEHVCRRVAAARIASNILPATGPVSSGGDQGRDFETHPTALADEIKGASPGTWAALAAQGRIAFAATIQRKDLRPKIEADVHKIMDEGPRPDRIHAFTAGSISKGQREKAIKNVQEKHGIELIVHDVVYLAEQLAASDLFWVAKRYLDVPDALAPEVDERQDDGAPGWYLIDRERWRSREPFPTMGDLLDLTDGLRRATLHPHAKPDFGFWLGLVRPLAGAEHPRDVRQRARYEVAVAVLRGQGSLFPADDLVEDYAAELRDDERPEAYNEAATLLQYTRNAVVYGQSSIPLTDLEAWEQNLVAILESRIASEDGPNRLAELLMTDGFLRLQPWVTEEDVSAEPRAIPHTGEWLKRDEQIAKAQRGSISGEMLKDVNAGMASWLRLARMLDQAPLFYVDDLAALLSLMTTALVDHADWRELTDKVESALARQSGQAVVAERCRDRAMLLRERSRHREALDELHRAKLDWWTSGTLRGALLSLLIGADSYHQLGLDHAASQCALSVAYVADSRTDPDNRDLMAPALAMAARMEYGWGAWLGAAELTEATVIAAAHYREGGVDPSSPMLEPVLVHAGMIEGAASVLLGEQASDTLGEFLERIQLTELLGGDPRAALKEAETLGTTADWDDIAREQLLGPPFQDLSGSYVLRFTVFGQAWSISALDSDDPACRRACERFAAAAQVLLLELSASDLCLLAAPVAVELGLHTGAGGMKRRSRTSGSARTWQLELSPVDAEIDDQMAELLDCLSTVILDTSLLPGKAYMNAVEAAFERGLDHKLFLGRPYDELRNSFADSELQAALADARRPGVAPDWRSTKTSTLDWPEGPGPTYTQELGRELALGRYEKIPARIPRQLAALRSEETFRDTVAELQRSGWPDHLLLLAVYNITLNFRAAAMGLDFRLAEDRARAPDLYELPETKGSPLAPPTRFLADEMDLARRMALPATLGLWKLTLHSSSPDLDAVESLLAKRYGYWTDDAEHEDPFPE
jgi:hypothetical protein